MSLAGLAAAAVAAVKFGVPWVLKSLAATSVSVHAANGMGMGWSTARTELVGQFESALGEGFRELRVPSASIRLLSECCAEKAIGFLNRTDCSYLYNAAITSKEEHLAEQEKCMAKVGYDEASDKFTLACLKENLPNDWSLMRAAIEEGFLSGAGPQVAQTTEMRRIATCFADKVIQTANASRCPLVSRAAARAEEWFNDISTCVSEQSMDGIASHCADRVGARRPARW